MIKGHLRFIVDSGIGHTKRELRRSDIFGVDHWAQVINRSAKTNKAKVVTGNDVYDWKKGLGQYFKPFVGIRELEINNRPILGRIFVRIQGVVTGA